MEPTAGLAPAEAEHSLQPLVGRFFTRAGAEPFDTVEWSRRDAIAGDFFQADVEAPADWSDSSVGVVAKLYFATVDGVRETSVRQMVHRVVAKITLEGWKQGHFGDACPDELDLAHEFEIGNFRHGDPVRIFYDELVYICLHQLAGFNTPTWLNIGVPGRKQCGHACYPLSVRDTMVEEGGSEGFGITNWWDKESLIFKAGGGSGVNLSNLRGSMEPLSTGGTASGPVVYMRPSNAGAETLKSGGAHRRAAKFVCLDADHPDVEDFIDCKVREDERMQALAAAGFNMNPMTPEGERNIAETTSFQSANHSVSVTDDFMERATGSGRRPREWPLTARVSREIIKTVDASELLHSIAEAAWKVADPGLIFIDTINRMHTTPSLGPVTTTNTCGEVTQNDDTACNLSALNVLKFINFNEDARMPEGEQIVFKIDDFRHTVDVMATAMDIVCGFSELPTKLITQNTRDLRQLGMGFTNLGAAIMAQGMPYDSDEARDFAASITALLTGRVYAHSSRMAEKLGAFKHFEANREPMLAVISRHWNALPDDRAPIVWDAARSDWWEAQRAGQEHGFRNALATAMMPTGTVSFLLGASPAGSTGIEPVVALTVEKRLAGAGKMTMVNESAALGARALGGYSEANLKAFGEGDWSACAEEDKAVFATALGSNSIAPMGHVRMVAAIQPFVSQAISKTVNVPNAATVDDMLEVYTEAWRMGVKVLSVYRDGSKMTQVVKAIEKKAVVDELIEQGITHGVANIAEIVDYAKVPSDVSPPPEPVRRRLPRTRKSVNHKIAVRSADGVLREGYILAGMYDDGSLGEIFLEGFGKQGGFVQNALSAWATDASVSFQYGVPLDAWARKHAYVSDETGGIVVPDDDNPPVLRECKSIVDYVARWVASEFGGPDLCEELGVMTPEVKARAAGIFDVVATKTVVKPTLSVVNKASSSNGHQVSVITGPPCGRCGGTMNRAGACWVCPSCGEHTGCG